MQHYQSQQLKTNASIQYQKQNIGVEERNQLVKKLKKRFAEKFTHVRSKYEPLFSESIWEPPITSSTQRNEFNLGEWIERKHKLSQRNQEDQDGGEQTKNQFKELKDRYYTNMKQSQA